MSFICHLNLVGWARLVMLVLKELAIRLGSVADQIIERFWDEMANHLTSVERERIHAFYQRMQEYDQYLDLLLAEYVKQVEKEYRELYQEIQETFRDDTFVGERAEHSVRLAEAAGVKKEKIVRSLDDLDDLFL